MRVSSSGKALAFQANDRGSNPLTRSRSCLISRMGVCRLRSPGPLAGIAQSVEHNLAKIDVEGSSPSARSEKVPGSSPGWYNYMLLR